MIALKKSFPDTIDVDDVFTGSLITYHIIGVSDNECIAITSNDSFTILNKEYLRSFCSYKGKSKSKYKDLFV